MKKSGGPKLSRAIGYIRKRVPSFDLPPYEGRRYEAMVPDTLDIQERIALAVNGLTGATDPEKNHLLYFRVEFRSNPPMMKHSQSDICQVKFMESLPLMRLASGSTLNEGVDPVWMSVALRLIGPDGLVYWPSLPWAKYPDWCEPCPRGQDHYSIPAFCGRMIGAMTLYMLRDPAGPWNRQIRRIVNGLRSIAIEKDDFAYFKHGGYAPAESRDPSGPMPIGIWSSLVGWTIHGLAQHHRVSGYEPAVDLAEKLSRYLAYHGEYFGPNGEFLPNDAGKGEKALGADEKVFDQLPPVGHRIHFQHHMVPLLGMLDHALAAGNRELAEFVRRSFEWGRTKGDILVGHFPENIDEVGEIETSESCEVAGMIGLALKLSAAGLGDYWDDADRWIRNQFAENQLLEADWIYHMAEAGMTTTRMRIPASQFDPVVDTVDRVPERNIGAFAGWPSANDWYIGHGPGIMHCCTGNATRALYYIWEHILSYERGTLKVNLLLNRPSQWADVNSHIPYSGQVDVSIKRACKRLMVRIPEWVLPRQVSCTVNGRPRALQWSDRYCSVEALRAKDTVTVNFPISERKVETNIEKQNYFLTIKGNDVVDIYPRGRFCPLYQRRVYRENTTRWKKVGRFVSPEPVYW